MDVPSGKVSKSIKNTVKTRHMRPLGQRIREIRVKPAACTYHDQTSSFITCSLIHSTAIGKAPMPGYRFHTEYRAKWTGIPKQLNFPDLHPVISGCDQVATIRSELQSVLIIEDPVQILVPAR